MKGQAPQWRERLKAATLSTALVVGTMSAPATAAPVASTRSTEVKASLTKVVEANNVDELVSALGRVQDATGDGEALISYKLKKEVVDTLKYKARNPTFEWNNEAAAAYSRLKFSLDPFYVVELRPFLQFGPFAAGILYLATLFVQQRKPEYFAGAYLASVAALLLPVLVLVNV